jgi:hypothetical protein
VPARKPGSFWPSCSSVLFFVSFGTPFGSGAVRTFYPRMFRGHREQHPDVCSADLGPQRPTEGTAAHSLFDALGLGQLGLSQLAKPGTTSRAFTVDDQPPVGAQNYSDQCTGGVAAAAPDARPDRGRRLPRSFHGASRAVRPLLVVAVAFSSARRGCRGDNGWDIFEQLGGVVYNRLNYQRAASSARMTSNSTSGGPLPPAVVASHSSAERASPPPAGCQTISPASFCTHSPSAHS